MGVTLTGSQPAPNEEAAALLFGAGSAQLATVERHRLSEAVSCLRRAFDYYAETGDVDRAVAEAVSRGAMCTLNAPEEVELAELLCSLHPWAEMVRYARSGGEAMAIAVRIARAQTRRDKVAFCGYHGWHDWYLSANLNHDDALADLFRVKRPGTARHARRTGPF